MEMLKNSPWVLVKDASGAHRHVTVAEAKSLSPDAIEYLRPEINFSVLMLMIALENYPDGVIDYLYSDEAAGSPTRGISALMFNAPGEATLKRNRDFFITRDQVVTAICERCYPGVAYAYTQMIGAGGRGFRPGAAANKSLYLIDAGTIEDIADSNQLPADLPAVARYFESPVYMMPAGKKICRCQICQAEADCYTEVRISANKEATSKEAGLIHPHAGTNNYNSVSPPFSDWKTKLHAIAYLADTEYSEPPAVIKENARQGDAIRFLGLHNPWGAVESLQEFYFDMPAPAGWQGTIRRLHDAAKILLSFTNHSIEFSPELAAPELRELSHSILDHKMPVYQAALHILDSKVPSSGDATPQSMRLYAETRKKILACMHKDGSFHQKESGAGRAIKPAWPVRP